MKIVIAGGTGQIGNILTRAFVRDRHEVFILTRNPRPSLPDGCRSVRWDAKNVNPVWNRELHGAGAVINLAGRSVNCRYTERNRVEILRSRVDSTLAIGNALRTLTTPPPLWIQASTATIYAHTFGPANDESGALGGSEPDAPRAWDFSIEVARAWEQATGSPPSATRLVLLRSAMTMSPDRSGVFDTLLRMARAGLGGPIGSGRQYVSWIHEMDFVRAIQWIMQRETIEGVINLASPHPLPNREFMSLLRAADGIRFGLPAWGPMPAIGAFLIRTETELILKSRRVVPGRLLREGFEFQYPEWRGAAMDLCARVH